MRAVLLITIALSVAESRESGTHPKYFVHNISAERWNKYICESCKYNYHPVCGSDLKTYSNPCMLSCAAQRSPGLMLLHRGECNTGKYKQRSMYATGCPECGVEPITLVCGHNEITYYNVCYFECYRRKHGLEGLTIAHSGPCFVDYQHHLKEQGNGETCICNRKTGEGFLLRHHVAFHVKKICGAVTLYNKCHYDCEAKNLGFESYAGICENMEIFSYKSPEIGRITYNPCKCSTRNDTVCAAAPGKYSDATLRKNSCFASCEREHVLSMDKCHPKKCNCSKNYRPTCAVQLFRDVCHFECNREIMFPGLTVHGVVSCPKRRINQD